MAEKEEIDGISARIAQAADQRCKESRVNLDPIPVKPVASSNIYAIGYDFKSATMAVVFREKDQPGKVYHYAPVPRPLFTRLARSESKGGFFARWIRDNAAIEFLLWCDCREFIQSGEHLQTCVRVAGGFPAGG